MITLGAIMKQINIKLVHDITPNMLKVKTNSDVEVMKERTNVIIKNMIILLYLFNNLIIIDITSLVSINIING
ncbi:hypothetical protein AN1V17_47160 [Vallitalea sediminicola]